MSAITWIYDDGGRADAGYRGDAHDCVVRALAIATSVPYQQVYDELFDLERKRAAKGRTYRTARSPRDGVVRTVYEPWLLDRGWAWEATMGIGTGCTVHLAKDELVARWGSGPLIACASKHLTAVVDGAVRDTHDPSRDGSRCVYGVYTPTAEVA